jgi:preprotein translocase subunit SecF
VDKIIARKRWFFLFSLLITIPGLIFTLATPISGGTIGLKFSIDYTGGTIWEFRPESPADPLVVQAAVASAGHEDRYRGWHRLLDRTNEAARSSGWSGSD